MPFRKTCSARRSFPIVVLGVASALLFLTFVGGSPARGRADQQVAAGVRSIELPDGTTATMHVLVDPAAADAEDVLDRLLPGTRRADPARLEGAFVVYPAKWPDDALPVAIGYNADGAPAGLAVESVLASVMDVWSAAGGHRFRFVFGGVSARDIGSCISVGARDGFNTVAWRNLPTGTLGVTCSIFATDRVTGGARIIEADMQLATGVKWSAAGQTPLDSFDLFSTVLHELGHVLGLDHSAEQNAVMRPSTSRGRQDRTLTPDDLAGLRAVYGDGSLTSPPAIASSIPSATPTATLTPTPAPRPPLPLKVIVAVISRN